MIRIQIPSLSERKEDISQLAQHFLKQAANELSVEVKTLHKNTLAYLEQCEWPGNVRQLENICRFLTVMASGKEILITDLPSELTEKPVTMTNNSQHSWQESLKTWVDNELALGKSNIIEQALPEFEKVLLESALKHTQGHKQEAAKRLGWGRNTLTRKLKELNMPD